MTLNRNVCSYKNCRNTRNSGVKFFCFPSRAGDRQDQWIRFCDNENLNLRVGSRLSSLAVVCQRHFTESCFSNTLHDRISRFSIPTLDGTSEVQQPTTQTSPNNIGIFKPVSTNENLEEIKFQTSECCVKGCIAAKTDPSFYFPMDEIRCRLWLKRCGNKSLYKLNKTALKRKKVCQKHFAPHAFTNNLRKYLKFDAVPSMFFHNKRVAADNNKEILQEDGFLPVPTVACSEEISALRAVTSEEILMEENEIPKRSPTNTEEISKEIHHSKIKASERIHIDIQASNCPLELLAKKEITLNFNSDHFECDILPKINSSKNQLVANQCAKKPKDCVVMSCGLVGCNDDLYSDSNNVKKLVKCSSKCRRFFHLQCTGLKKEEYDILCNNDALRWFCMHCRIKA